MPPATPNARPLVVVSYAREDGRHRRTFRTNVAALERGGVDFFDDQDIPVGHDWRSTLLDAVDRADIFVPLITAHYVASDFSMEEELGRAVRRAEAGECRIFGVHVAPFDEADDSPLLALQYFPSDYPISGLPAPAARKEWREVTRKLRNLIDDLGDGPGGGPAAPSPPAAAPAPAGGAGFVFQHNNIGTVMPVEKLGEMTINMHPAPPTGWFRRRRRSH